MSKKDNIDTFIDETYSTPPKKNYETNNILHNHIDETRSIDLADMIHYKISNNKGFRDIFVIIDKDFYRTNCEYNINKQKHQIDKKVQRQERDFSTRLNYANKKIREIWMNMVNTTYNSTQDMIIKLQQLKGKTKLKFYKNISNYYKEMKNTIFQAQEDLFSGSAQGISKIYHELLLLMLFLQTKPQIKSMNFNYYDL